MIAEIVGCEENEFEVSKRFLFEQGKMSKRIVIGSVLLSKKILIKLCIITTTTNVRA